MVRLAPQWCVWRRSGAFGAATVRLAPLRCVWRRNGAFGAWPLDLGWTYKFLLSTLPILVRARAKRAVPQAPLPCRAMLTDFRAKISRVRAVPTYSRPCQDFPGQDFPCRAVP